MALADDVKLLAIEMAISGLRDNAPRLVGDGASRERLICPEGNVPLDGQA